MHQTSIQSVSLQEVLIAQRNRQQNQPRIKLGVTKRAGRQDADNIKSLLVPEDAEDIVYMQTELNFEEFLEFLRCVREYNDEQRLEELMERFQRLDKDRNGEAQCCPRTRKEQEEVQQLIQSVDADGNNVIDFDEFKDNKPANQTANPQFSLQELVQRIDEKFASLRYDSEVEYALARGFTETELGSFRAIFEHLDADNSGQLDMAEVRQCLSIMQHNSTWQAFEQTWILLDKDASGTLEFEEFIDFMRLMRDGEGVFAMDNAPRAARDANRCAAQDIVTGSGPEAAITCQEVGRADASICFGALWTFQVISLGFRQGACAVVSNPASPLRPLDANVASSAPSGRYAADFEELRLLGKGGFGTVTKARHRVDRQLYAIKRQGLSRYQHGGL
eukprot:g15686.t1